MSKPRAITERRAPTATIVCCTCGWSRTITRRQNALARAAKVRAARNEHARQVAAARGEG